MNPVMIAFDGNARNARFFQGLENFDGLGKGLGQDLPCMKEITTDQDKINSLAECIRHDPRQTPKKILVPFRFSGRVTVGLAQMDVSGVNEFHFIKKIS
jgi:hypothetical protein